VKKGMRHFSCLLIREWHTYIFEAEPEKKIDEFVIRPGYRVPEDEAKFTQAPEPLLPNYGKGRIRQYSMDMNMMVMFNTAERTLDDFIKLGGSARLKFVKLWEMGETGLVEFELQEQ